MSETKKIDSIQERVESLADSVASIDKETALTRAALEDHTKADERMYDELRRMNDILQQNTDSLKEHMFQTKLLKDMVVKMDARLSPIEVEYIQKAAVKTYLYKNAKFIAKMAAAIAAIASAWVYAKPILEHLLK